ncbi:MAG: YjaG family protein [Succinivibrionaceae bacterium]|nr:YjaG family protein [Succinivibrionaceae bacterium]
MIFGEKFYPLLRRLSPWRQSLFALTLAQRLYPHYALWCEMGGQDGLRGTFLMVLNRMWEYHADKGNTIDLAELGVLLEPCIPDPGAGSDLGGLFALDAALCLDSSCDAIVLREGGEAEVASRASLATAVRFEEQRHDVELGDDELRECEAVDREVDFQVALMEGLSRGARGPELVARMRELGHNGGVSGIGIECPAGGDAEPAPVRAPSPGASVWGRGGASARAPARQCRGGRTSPGTTPSRMRHRRDPGRP